MSATPIAVPVAVIWTVTASGQSSTVTPATPMQVSVAQVHVGLKGTKGDKGDVGDVNPLMVSLAAQATDAKTDAETAAQAAALSASQATAAADATAVLEAESQLAVISMAASLVQTPAIVAAQIAAQ